MASVIVQRVGAEKQTCDAETIGDLKKQLGLSNYSAEVKCISEGETSYSSQGDDFQLSDGDMVKLAQNTKGGNQ